MSRSNSGVLTHAHRLRSSEPIRSLGPSESIRPLRIIADDLTGAADTAGSWVPKFGRVELFFRAEDVPAEACAASIDLNSRLICAEAALGRVSASAVALSRGSGAGRFQFYKKVDSALRGHIAVETKAFLDSVPSMRAALIAPAFPAMGRTMMGGYAFDRGERLDHISDSMRERFIQVANRPEEVVAVDLETVRSVKQSLRRTIDFALEQGARYFLVDAENENDLMAAVEGFNHLCESLLYVGSAGLARVMAGGVPPRHFLFGPTLVVAGSHNRATLSQLEALRADPAISFIGIERRRMTSRLSESETAAFGNHARQELESGRDVVLCVDDNSLPVAVDEPALSMRLARIAGCAIGAAKGIVLTGGDTARSVLSAFGVRQLTVLGEVSVGLPFCRLRGSASPICLKSGGFGDTNLLLDLLREARGAQRDL
jgi:uncharacterized protein YgbK (DUF1537 family)